MTWLAILLILTSLALLPLVYWYYVLFKFRSLSKIPGPKPIPLVGNYFCSSAYDILLQFMARSRKYGSTFKLFTGPQLRVVTTNPAILEYVMSSNVHLTKSDSYNFAKPWLGDGLLISTGPKWKDRRRLITPTFHFQILEEFMETFNASGQILIKQLSKKVGQKSLDIYPIINHYTLDIICETSMGTKINALENEGNIPYVQAVKGFLELLRRRFFLVWERFDLIYQFTPQFREMQKHIKVLHEFTSKVIEQRRQEYNVRKRSLVKEDDCGIKKRNALLDMLLQSENANKLTDEDLREEIDTFMFEGHDTVTSGISFTLFELAKDQKIQQRLYEEIVSVLGTKEIPITMQHLQEMKYLDLVVKEGQRITPSVPIIERTISKDCIIEGVKYPKDTVITMFIYGLHQDPLIYPEPTKFDPDRFLLENQVKRSHFAYVPFSAGARNCIGQKFAVLESKLAIAKILQKFQLLPIDGFNCELEMNGVVKSRNGVCVQLKNRTD